LFHSPHTCPPPSEPEECRGTVREYVRQRFGEAIGSDVLVKAEDLQSSIRKVSSEGEGERSSELEGGRRSRC